VFDPRTSIPFVKLYLALTAFSLITLTYSHLSEFRSTLILHLALLCVRNNPTLVAALRIQWFIKPITYQAIFQRRQTLGLLVKVYSWSATNIWCQCHDCGVWLPCLGSLCEAFPFPYCIPLITVAYSCLSEFRSTLILPLPIGCMCNNLTLFVAFRIGWFIKPYTHQTICQWT